MGFPPRHLARWWVTGAECMNSAPACCRTPADSCPPFHFSKIPRSCHQNPTTLQILAVSLNYFKRVEKVQKCFSFLQLCNEFFTVPESELSSHTILYWYSTDANSSARLEAARSQLHGRNMWRSTLSVHIPCGFGLACLILFSSDLQTAEHGSCRLMDMISIPGKMTVSIIKKISEYMTKHRLIQELLLH